MKVIIESIATEYQDEGHGPALLLLHGWKTDLHSFDAIASLLSPSHRVVRLDLPGFGKTETPQKPWNLDSYVEFTAAFIEKLWLREVCIVGHSFGGRVVIKGTGDGKLQPEKIILIASAGVAKTNSLRNRFFKAAAKVGKVVTSIPPLTLARDSLRKNLYESAGSDYLNAGELKSTYLNVVNEDLTEIAAHVHVPTLLVWGSNDTETPLADGKLFAKQIKNSKLEVLEGAGHFVFQEEPAKVAQLIGEFLA